MPRYRVKRLTAFAWVGEVDDRVPWVARTGELAERALRERYRGLEPKVEMVVVGGHPQLVFALTIYALTEVEARRRATFRFERALVQALKGNTAPWGDIGVERL